MADGGDEPEKFDDVGLPTSKRDRERWHQGRVTACILDFVEGRGAASSGFIAEYYNLDHQQVKDRCWTLTKEGRLVRWFFDGVALFGLPKNAPCLDVLTAPLQTGRGRRRPRDPQKLAEWRLK